ncbi:hydrogenase maturation protease [Lachnospiraceae bacterium 54-53]
MVKLIAVGNRFMKDDGIAVKAAELLESRLAPLGLPVIIGETDCQSCFYLLNEDDFVIILDAFFSGEEPGSIHTFSLSEAVSQSEGPFLQHDMSLFELIKLHGSPSRGRVIGIEIGEIGFGDELSPVLRDRLPQVCGELENTIKEILWEESIDA